MRHFSYKKFLLVACSIFALIALPTLCVEAVRGVVIATFSPIWSLFSFSSSLADEHARLLTENHLLKTELGHLRAELAEYKGALPAFKTPVVARVIYRDPSSWSSALWVDVGKARVQKNSPVLVGKSVVGVVDHVGKRYARVRLITDSALQPAVRVFRAQENDLSKKPSGWYGAKGILKGAGTPLWRSRGARLKGIGFNYDFADDKGPARDLSGAALDSSVKVAAEPLIKVNDLLVTSGMDGVFPADLKVAVVSRIYPLLEGAYSYEIEAKATAGSLDELKRVVIIAPLEFEKEAL